MGLHVLVNLTTVNIQVDNLRLFGIGLQITRHSVAETHTDGNEHITLLFLQVDSIVAVHTEHADIQRVIGRQCREAKHRSTCRDIGFLQELLQFLLGIAKLYTLPYQRQGFLGVIDQFCRLTDSLFIKFRIGNIAAHEVNLLRLPVDFLGLRILREVEYHRTGTACTGNIESTTDGPGHILGTTYLIAPLGDRLRHTHKVNLLESIGTQGTNRHLTGNHHQRRGIHHGISNTRQRVGHTRATGDQGHTYLTAHSGIALCGMCGSLFVAHQDMVEAFLLTSCIVEERIIDGHDGTTRVTKDGLDTLGL